MTPDQLAAAQNAVIAQWGGFGAIYVMTVFALAFWVRSLTAELKAVNAAYVKDQQDRQDAYNAVIQEVHSRHTLALAELTSRYQQTLNEQNAQRVKEIREVVDQRISDSNESRDRLISTQAEFTDTLSATVESIQSNHNATNELRKQIDKIEHILERVLDTRRNS